MKKSWNLANFILNLVIFLISWVRTVKQNVSSVFQCNKKSRKLLILPRLLIIILFNNVMVLCIIQTYSYPIPHCTPNVMYSQSTQLVLCTASIPGQSYVQLVYLLNVLQRQSTQLVLCTASLPGYCYVQLVYLACYCMYSQSNHGQCYVQIVCLAVHVELVYLAVLYSQSTRLVLCTARFMFTQSTW